jgi:hypothetical protein
MKREKNKGTKQKTEVKRQGKQGTEEKGAERKNEFEILKAMAMKITMVVLWHRAVWYKEHCSPSPSK